MKFETMIRSIPDEKTSIGETHARLVTAMDGVPKPWGFGGGGGPPTPDCGRELLVETKLYKHLGRGVRGSIIYRYRGGLGDEDMYDDFMVLEFDPMRQDYARMLETVLPRYIAAFQAYVAYVGDVEWGLADWEETKRQAPNGRRSVHRIYPVHYFGDVLCRRAFKRSPEELARLLSKECERADLLSNGVLLVATIRPVELDEADRINQRLWGALTGGGVAVVVPKW